MVPAQAGKIEGFSNHTSLSLQVESQIPESEKYDLLNFLKQFIQYFFLSL